MQWLKDLINTLLELFDIEVNNRNIQPQLELVETDEQFINKGRRAT